MIAKTKICLVCFKPIIPLTNQTEISQNADKFWGFAKEYLGISILRHKPQIPSNCGLPSPFNGQETFCKNCEDLIQQICKLYHQLLEAQLHLCSKLGELSELVKHSEESVSYKLGRLLIDSLAKQLGISKAAHLDKLRKLLRKKCMEESRISLPLVKIERMQINPNVIKVSANDPGSDFSGTNDNDMDEGLTDDNTGTAGQANNSGGNEDGMESGKDDMDDEQIVTKTEEKNDDPEDLENVEVEEDLDSSYDPSSSSDSDFSSDSDSEEKSTSSVHTTIKTSTNGGKFLCTSCPKVFLTLSLLSKHYKGVHSGLKFTCPECHISVKTRQTLVKHIQAIHKPESHVCSICSKVYKTKKYLKEHIGQVHAGLFRRHRCPNCTKSYFKKQELKAHILKQHGESNLRELEADGTIQERLKVVRTPKINKQNGNSLSRSETVKYSCLTCAKVFKSAKILSRHKTRIHGEKKHLCAECGASFTTTGSLNKHITVVHNPETHICPHCGKIFKFEFFLKNHIRKIHEAAKMHPKKRVAVTKEKGSMQEFKICGMPMKIGFRKAMEMHLRTHMSDEEKTTVFLCDTCGKEFTTKSACKMHSQQFHEGVKREFQCEKCSKSFYLMSKLKRHVLQMQTNPRN